MRSNRSSARSFRLRSSLGWTIGLALAFASQGCGGCGPIGPFSGGRLSGEGVAWPTDLSGIAAFEQAQLETNPDDPHSINIWFVTESGDLFLATSLLRGPDEPEERDWVRNVAADPRVRIRIDGLVYRARLKVLEDGEERARVFRAYLEKYPDLDPSREDAARFFRVVPRGASS